MYWRKRRNSEGFSKFERSKVSFPWNLLSSIHPLLVCMTLNNYLWPKFYLPSRDKDPEGLELFWRIKKTMMYICNPHIVHFKLAFASLSRWNQAKQFNSVTVVVSSEYPVEIDSGTSCLLKFQYVPFHYLVAFSATRLFSHHRSR